MQQGQAMLRLNIGEKNHLNAKIFFYLFQIKK